MLADCRPWALVAKSHSALHAICRPVDRITPHVLDVAGRMVATCRAVNGLALAAPQVGIPWRMVAGRDGNVLCNPRLELGDEWVEEDETCLSLPGKTYRVARATTSILHGMLLDGTWATFHFDGSKPSDAMLSRLWQHECDHLDGRMIG